MTNTQAAYFTKLTNQMFDYDRITDKELIVEHIERIPDNKLKSFYEKLLKDKLTKKKGFISMITFVNLADIEIQKYIGAELANLQPQIDILFSKREQVQKIISDMYAQERADFILALTNKKAMFGTKEDPFFNEIETFVIEKQFGWNSFCNPDNNYLIKEEIVKGFKYYLMKHFLLVDESVKKLGKS